jgi:hypothetical protein
MTIDLRAIRDAAGYTPLFCEENVFRFLQFLRKAPTAFSSTVAGCRAWSLFISNPGRSVAMLCQKSSPRGSVVWDYHVVALVEPDLRGSLEPLLVCDSDSSLPFPCPLQRYLKSSFPEAPAPRYSPRFRLVEAEDYLRELASDRSHMLDSSGRWLAPPPPWPAPGEGSGRVPNLMDFVDMEKEGLGRVFGLAEMADPRTCT